MKDTYQENAKDKMDDNIKKMFDECYNVGVEHCIEVVNNSRLPIIDHIENYHANKVIHEIYLKLCQLKKPIQ